MPLVAHRDLESLARIREEGQEVLDVERALQQDIRELHIGLLNIMPDGALRATERQFLRLIGNCNRIAQFYVHIFTVPGVPRSAAMQAYIDQHYERAEDVMRTGLDALIVTGTNPLHDDFGDEPFWPHTRAVFEWADEQVSSVLCSCLASHAAFQYFYGIRREKLPEKLFGVYEHRVLARKHPLLANINTRFDMPHSRRNDVSQAALAASGVPVLVASEQAGAALCSSADGFKRIYLQGHPEYDEMSLLKEYHRDLSAYFRGERPDLPNPPANYFSPRGREILDTFLHDANNDMRDFPMEALCGEIDITWRDTAKAIFANWLGLVYQLTHRDRDKQFMDGVDPRDPLGLRQRPM